MNLSSLPSWSYPALIGAILISAGVGEYLHIVSAGTFNNLLLVAIGIMAPSPVQSIVHTTSAPPPATQPESKS